MMECPMVSKGYSCKSNFRMKVHLVSHLVTDHNAVDVADSLVSVLGELNYAERELERLTHISAEIPKDEENKSEGAIP